MGVLKVNYCVLVIVTVFGIIVIIIPGTCTFQINAINSNTFRFPCNYTIHSTCSCKSTTSDILRPWSTSQLSGKLGIFHRLRASWTPKCITSVYIIWNITFDKKGINKVRSLFIPFHQHLLHLRMPEKSLVSKPRFLIFFSSPTLIRKIMK